MESLWERDKREKTERERERTERWWLIISVWLRVRPDLTSGQGQKSFILEWGSAWGNVHILASLVQCTWPCFHLALPCVKTPANTITHPQLRYHTPLTISLHSALNALLTHCAHPHSSHTFVHCLLTTLSSIVVHQFQGFGWEAVM